MMSAFTDHAAAVLVTEFMALEDTMDYLVPAAVEEIICREHLYREQTK